MVTRRFGEASHAKVVSPRCLAEYFNLSSVLAAAVSDDASGLATDR